MTGPPLQVCWPTIASVFGVSLRTIRRRMEQYNDNVIREIKVQFPNSGYRLMDGLLRHRGMRVQQCRIREATNTGGKLTL